jgi:hypothetical protein
VAGFLKACPHHCLHNKNKKRGGVVEIDNNPIDNNPIDNNPSSGQQGFSTEDIIWALGVWSVILSLSPVVVFYMLMVA